MARGGGGAQGKIEKNVTNMIKWVRLLDVHFVRIPHGAV